MAEHDRTKSRGKPPISRHPLFPATVALWFGALFGLGSAAIRPSALDGLAQTLHLGALGTIFEPPVDTAGRVLIVLVMAAVGAALGLAMARRMAAPNAPAAATATASSTMAQPELSETESMLWSELRSQRRELESEPGQPAADAQVEIKVEAPALEREPQILDLAAIQMERDEGPPVETSSIEIDEPTPDIAPEDDPLAEYATDWLEPQEPVAEAPDVDPMPAEEEPAEPQESAAERIAGADLNELSHVELLERLALSMQQRSERMAAERAVPVDELTCETSPELEPGSETTQAHATLEPHDVAQSADHPETVTTAEPAAFAVAEAGPTAAIVPVAKPAEAPASESADIEDDVLAEGYSSLLGLGRPSPLRPFVRVQQAESVASEPPVVFPGHAERRSAHRTSDETAPTDRRVDAPGVTEALPEDPLETEKALRQALAALQRMSGAA